MQTSADSVWLILDMNVKRLMWIKLHIRIPEQVVQDQKDYYGQWPDVSLNHDNGLTI